MSNDLPDEANTPTYYGTNDVDLICAAPDLLAMCKTIAEEFDYALPESTLHRLLAVIAKAEGTSSGATRPTPGPA